MGAGHFFPVLPSFDLLPFCLSGFAEVPLLEISFFIFLFGSLQGIGSTRSCRLCDLPRPILPFSFSRVCNKDASNLFFPSLSSLTVFVL